MHLLSESSLNVHFYRFEDVATIKVPQTCPSQLKEKGENKFRARAFFENYFGQDHFFDKLGAGNLHLPKIIAEILSTYISDDTPTKLTATASFSNGSTWAAEFNFKAFKSETFYFHDRNGWLSCANNEWYSLPSGHVVCLVKEITKHESRKETCEKAGGFLAEITTRDDAQALMYIIYKLNKAGHKSTGAFSVGAKAHNGRWVWEKSGKDVELGIGQLLKPASTDVDLFPYPDTFLYLSLYNPPSSSGNSFMSDLPYFDLFAQPGGDAEEEYLCMKKGGQGLGRVHCQVDVSIFIR